MTHSMVTEKSLDLSVKILKIYRYLTAKKKEYEMSKYLFRSGMSIGAQAKAAQNEVNPALFAARMRIALHEAIESETWLRLMYKTRYLTAEEYASIDGDVKEIIQMLTVVCEQSLSPFDKKGA